MSVGINAIDADHQLLIELINDLSAFSPDSTSLAATIDQHLVIGQVFESLNRYVRIHFQREEKVLAEIDYQALDTHRAQHSHFMAEISRLQLEFYKHHNQYVPEKLSRYLKTWLSNHILIDDMAYKEVLKDNPAAQLIAASLEPIKKTLS